MPSFAIPKFTVLLEPLWVSAEFLLLSTGPLSYNIRRKPGKENERRGKAVYEKETQEKLQRPALGRLLLFPGSLLY